ncbi:MAG TPA: FTR1 family protein [Anaerolineales bacterium]|nr:FTR1 family protein [Anaerolineales bacterium]
MLTSFLLAWREGLEIALIVGIIFGALYRFKREDLFVTVELGIASAIATSLVVAIALNIMGASFEGDSEAIFEGVMMWMAAGLLTWMILWMQARAAQIKNLIQEDVRLASRAGKLSIFVLAFVAVVREGIELAFFLTASVFTSNLSQTLLGAVGGLALALLMGWGLYRATIRLNLRSFFRVTSILLIFFAAGLVAHGTHEFNEVGFIPGIIEPLWDVNNILPEDSLVGQVAKTLFGYNGNPTLTEVISYLMYFAALYLAARPRKVSLPASQEVPTSG